MKKIDSHAAAMTVQDAINRSAQTCGTILAGKLPAEDKSDRDAERIFIIKDHLSCPLREGRVQRHNHHADVFSCCKETSFECHTIHAFPENCPLLTAEEALARLRKK
jgi:hypothetical protein